MTVNQQTLEGNWDSIKGKLRAEWGQLTDDELQKARGNVDQLIGVIQRKTGQARGKVEAFLNKVAENHSSMVNDVSDKVQQYTEDAVENLQGAGKQVADSARAGYIQAERVVRNRPAESLAVCFGTGLITGVVLGLVLRR